ncbi:MAG: B12-binding domain-containing radical SAM protein [Thermoplasmata archaeon]|nr:MAG: B12-binding domain-containing radical SAM protein [Thermoplasmata archaeon]
MKILFVKPDKSLSLSKVRKKSFKKIFIKITDPYWPKSLAFPILAALTPREYEIEVAEGGFDDINFDGDYDLVGITCVTINALLAYKIADEFRRRRVTVVLGGYHPSALPEEAKQHADAVVVGEAEETWPQLLHDFKNNSLKPFYIQRKPVDAKNIPKLRLDIYPKNASVPLMATRGCPYNCEFCAISHMGFRKIFRMRKIDDVIGDINALPSNFFIFYDNSLTISPKYTKELFRKMMGLNKSFAAYGNVDVLQKDEELLKLSSEAGCRSWFIGFDSICEESLNEIGKISNKVDYYLKAVTKIHDYGMMVQGSFIFGFDHDTLDVFKKTDEFIRVSEIDHISINILTPFPGTPLFRRFKSEGRILTYDWSRYDPGGDVVFQPKHMTPEELYQNAKDLHKKWYSTPANVRRIFRSTKFGYNALRATLGVIFYEKTQNW